MAAALADALVAASVGAFGRAPDVAFDCALACDFVLVTSDYAWVMALDYALVMALDYALAMAFDYALVMALDCAYMEMMTASLYVLIATGDMASDWMDNLNNY